MDKKQVLVNTVEEIDIMLAQMREDCIASAKTALNSGSIADNSEFLDRNALLARLVLEHCSHRHKILSVDYRKEADNIRKFL